MQKHQKNKKILIVTQPEAVNTVGGAITVFVNFCNMLADNMYDVYAVCYNKMTGIPRGMKDNVNFSNLCYEYENSNFSEAINKKVGKVKPDLIIFFFHYLYIDANLSDKYKDIPRILMFHSRPDFYFEIMPGSAEQLKSLYKNTVAQILFDGFYNLLPDFIKSNPVMVIPNGVNIPSSTQINTDIEHKKIIYLSRIDCWKGLEFLIYSFKKIAKKYPDWSIDIYGQSQPPDYINQLCELTKKLKVDKQVFFKGVTHNPSEIFKHYDFCVFPSYFEGFGIGLAEAQISGLPCIGLANCTGVNSLIIDGYNGYLAKENYGNFASKIEKLILDKDKRAELSKNSVLEIKKYDINIINHRWLEAIEKIMSNNLCFDVETKTNIKAFPIKKIIDMAYKKNKLKWYQNILSVKNSIDKRHKIFIVFGFKFSIKRKPHKKNKKEINVA